MKKKQLNLLTKEDYKKSEIYENIENKIDEEIKQYRNELRNKYYKEYTYEECKNKFDKYYNLVEMYNFYKLDKNLFIFDILAIPLIWMAYIGCGNNDIAMFIACLIGIIGLTGLLIKQLYENNIANRIKDNIKEISCE